MPELHATIREAIARWLPLMLDRNRFLSRIVDVISESSGYPSVAIYVTAPDKAQLTLGAATDRAPQWLPARIPVDAVPGTSPQVVDAARLSNVIHPDGARRVIAAPLGSNSTMVGLLLLTNVDETAISTDVLASFGIVADEIAPAIGIAAHHYEVERASVIDLDTGAYTYDYFLSRLDEETSRAQRSGHALTIVFVEAWNFEDFERAAGYDAADKLLQNLANGFAAAVRSSDIVARRHRARFALLMPESNVDGAHVAIARIARRIERIDELLRNQGYSGPTPAIISSSATFPDDGTSSAALVLVADQRILAQAHDPGYVPA